ncbi:aldo/keto reductase [Acidocella sp.]|uniref:aldo/keto reductase n=1 Tax=Acidocella sp. TaxID=50710 RepID=UPI003D04DC93
MSQIDAARAGTFKIGGDQEVARLGFGAMRITGPGIWGQPSDQAEALRTLRRVPELGIDLIDTADSYGPDVSEQLIREALHPYGTLRIATKGGLTRSGPNQWAPKGDPAYLIGQARRSRETLGVEAIDLWQLHRIDPAIPSGEQFAAVRALLDEGVIRHAGLSEVSVAQIEAARKIFPVATVQNRYNLSDRASEDVLNYCEQCGIGFIPWYPLAAGKLAGPGTLLDGIASAHKASAGQIALAWLLRRSAVMLPIPGTGKVRHLEENTAAASIHLTEAEFDALAKAGTAGAAGGG